MKDFYFRSEFAIWLGHQLVKYDLTMFDLKGRTGWEWYKTANYLNDRRYLSDDDAEKLAFIFDDVPKRLQEMQTKAVMIDCHRLREKWQMIMSEQEKEQMKNGSQRHEQSN
ncbi:hypothetical protein LU293_04310 [Moraxella nasovis]|uniref:hypothetical protein n=1 Tax=Moraxella nasovis TaxID=2904121 RepID=UPI001F60CCC2|nr:hypothetical protein [Moraxella nasovis]UNU74126.1 hypothetical protein LU293_04310 [Moraxella nasovis]